MQTELIFADCLPELRDMKSASVDLLLTDPPCGIGFADSAGSIFRLFRPTTWDDAVPALAYFEQMLRVARSHVIWGGNYFAHLLPPSNGWLV